MAQRPDETLQLLVAMGRATDERLRAAARRLAGRVVLDLGRSARPRRRGIGRLRTVPAHQGGELDLDASLGAIAEARATGRALPLDELRSRTWQRPELAVCLLIDASGSMSGERLATAALTAAACSTRAPRDHAVLSFARDVRTLRSIRSDLPAATVVDRVLALRGHGITALASALRAAARQLGDSRADRKVVILLSDCRATDDEDPVAAARGLAELAILAPASDDEQAAAFAASTGARWVSVSGPTEAPAALRTVLGG